ncbi:MAG: acetolactate synthase small subunit [Clostridia bacterium]|nr:acetolactate synthase small subunit [Clostridia bacterium]
MLKTISVLVDNKAGVLARVTNLFSRRGYNIDSLAVGTADRTDVSRITVIVDCDDRILDQIVHQLEKLVNVRTVKVLSDISNVTRELVLIKVKAPASVRNDIIQIAEVFRGRIIDISTETLTIEITGEEHKTTALMDMLKVYEILEVARTGKVALDRGMEYISYKDEE